MSIRTRPPELEDAQPLARMIHQVWRATYGSMLPPEFWDGYPVAERADELRASIADRAQSGLVATSDDDLAGWALRGPSRSATVGIDPARRVELYSLYVHAPRAGVGQRLLDELLGEGPAELWVFEANARAQRFYERNGFSQEGARHVYRPETAGITEVRFAR